MMAGTGVNADVCEQRVCRTCLSSSSLEALFPRPAHYRTLQIALRLATGLQMDFSDGLPQYLCRICNETVEALMLFRFQSQTANEALCQFYDNKNREKAIESVMIEVETLKLEKLPTPDEIKNEAKNKLSEFYATRKCIPKTLYCITDSEKDNQSLIIERAQLPHISEIKSTQSEILKCDLRRSKQNDALTKKFKRAHESKSTDKNTAELEIKPLIDETIVKKEFKTESKRKRHIGKRNVDTSDTDDDDDTYKYDSTSDRDVGSDIDDDITLDKVASSEKSTWDIAVDDNFIEVKPIVDIDTNETRLTRSKSIKPRASRFQSKVSKTSRNGKRPVKKIYIMRKDKKEEFRKKCRELIVGPYDHKSKNVECKICHNFYKDVYTFERHAQRHLGYRHVCEHCQKGFESRDILIRHIDVKHPEGATDVNEQVKKDAEREEFRQKSLELIDGPYEQTSKNVKCKLCKNTYKDVYSFMRHAQRHLGYKHVCEYCQRGFESRDVMIRHVQKKHPDELTDDACIPPLKSNDIIRRYNDEQRKAFRKKCLELVEGPAEGDKIQCRECGVVCKSLRYFEIHAQKHLGFSHLCEFCARGFPSQAALNRHHRLTHESKPEGEELSSTDKPPIKRKPKESRKNLYALIEGPYHSKSKNVQCKVCKGFFSNLQAFANHAQRHVGFKHLCEFCAKGFPSKAHLKQHLQAKHNFAREFACTYCDYMAIYQKQLQIHTMRFHTKERPFVCDECGSGYFSKPVLTQHIRQSHQKERPFQCDECPRRFKQLNQRNYHKKMQHHPTFKFLCHICNNTFTKSRHVRKHFLKIHKIPREQQVEKVHRLYFDKQETFEPGNSVEFGMAPLSQGIPHGIA